MAAQPIILSPDDVHQPPPVVLSPDNVHQPPPVPVQLADADIHKPSVIEHGHDTPAKPTPEHRDRLSRALRDLDQWRARRGEHGAEWTARSTGNTHRVGDRVSVNGQTGTIVRKHQSSGLPEIDWDTEEQPDEPAKAKATNWDHTWAPPASGNKAVKNWKASGSALATKQGMHKQENHVINSVVFNHYRSDCYKPATSESTAAQSVHRGQHVSS